MADGTKATKRNPIMMLVLVIGISIGANIVGGIVAGILSSGMVAQLFSLVGYVGALFIVMGMVAELKKVGNNDLTPWWTFVPILNLYLFFMKLPEAMKKAKDAAGAKNPTKPGWMYLLFSPYALAADLNDLA